MMGWLLSFGWALHYHLFRRICMWYARMHVGFLFLYLTVGVGALSTVMVYQAHGGTGYFMSYAWAVI